MRREQQTLVRRDKQRVHYQGMRSEQQTLVGVVNRELLPESSRDEERAAKTGRRSKQRMHYHTVQGFEETIIMKKSYCMD